MSIIEQGTIFSFIEDTSENSQNTNNNTSQSTANSSKATTGKKQSSNRSKGTKPVVEEEKFEVNAETIIRYDSENLPITNYFSLDELSAGVPSSEEGKENELRPITGEDLRKRMVDEYGELLEELCVMVFNKEKNLVVPVLQARKKGGRL